MPSPRQSALGPSVQEPYVPISGKERANWFVKATIGPQSLASGVFTSALNTARDKPVDTDRGGKVSANATECD